MTAFIAFFPVIYFAGMRGYIADTTQYIYLFERLPDQFRELSGFLSSYTKDTGFTVLSSLIKIYLTKDWHLYLLIIAAIQGLCLVSVYRKYSRNYFISIFLFVASTDFFSWMYNGIRQFLAVTLLFLVTTLILQKRYIPLIAIILLVSSLHRSALLMIPIVFIANGKAWNRKTIYFIIALIIVLLFIGEFTEWLDETLSETQYKNVVSDYRSIQDDGTHPLRVLVYAVPTIISFMGRKTIKDSNNPLINLCVNMSIISTGLYIISMFTSGIYMGRLPIYASLYNYILLPWEMEYIIPARYKQVAMGAMVFFYLLFFYFQMHFITGVL